MQKLAKNDGVIDIVNALRDGKMPINDVVDEANQAFLSALQQACAKMMCREITPAEYQSAYKAVDDNTTTSPLDLNYSI